MTVESAREAFLNNQIGTAIDILDRILQNESAQNEDTLFDARCVRGSIAAISGSKEDPFIQQSLRSRGSSRSEASIKLYLEGTALLRAGQPQSALLKFQQILRDDPHFVAARMGLAAVYMAEKQWNDAFGQYSEVLARTGKQCPAIVRVGLALCALRKEEYGHAKRCLLRALQLEPNDDLACMAMVVVQLQQRDGPGAAESVKRLYALAPESPIAVQKFADLVFFKGITSGRLADISHAIRDLISTAARLDTDAAAATTTTAAVALTKEARHRIAYTRFQLGRLEHYEGKIESAVALYKEAIAVLGTSCKAAVLYLTKAYYQLGKTDEALRCLESLEGERKADKDVYTMLIAHHEMAGNHVRSMFYTQKLTDEFGIGDVKSFWLRAFSARHNTATALKHIAIGKAIPSQPLPDRALRTEEFLRAQQPQTAGAALGEMLSTLQKVRNEKDEAKVLAPAAVAEALAASPELLPHYYNVACTMASSSTAVLTSSSSGAAASSSASSSSSSSSSYTAAEQAAAARRLQASQKIFVTIIKLFPTFIDPYYRLAEVYLATRHYAAALKWLSLALHVRPNDGHCLALIAKLYYDNKNARVAMDTLRRGLTEDDDFSGGEKTKKSSNNNGEEDDSSDNADASAEGGKKKNSIVASMALGSLLLWSAQQPSAKAPRHLLGARECFSRPLRADPKNALAAHGLACAVGIGGNAVSAGAKSELAENTISTVASLALNDPTVQEGCLANLLNCVVKSAGYKRIIDALLPRADKDPSAEPAAALTAAQFGTLGYSLAADGQLEAAGTVIQKGIDRFPESQALRYNRILVLYARITKAIGTGGAISEEAGKAVRALLVVASNLSHEFVSQKHSGTEMGLAAFSDAQHNVKDMAKQLSRLEECLQAAVRKGVIETRYLEKKQQEWRAQAAQRRAEEEQRARELAEAEEEAALLKAEKSRQRYTAMLSLQRASAGGGDATDATLAMVRGYAGEVFGEGAEGNVDPMAGLSPEEQAQAIADEALLTV